MEGGVMLSRSYGSVEPFDLAVAQLRKHFSLLAEEGKKSTRKRQSFIGAVRRGREHPH
jgi:hypothetical protein